MEDGKEDREIVRHFQMPCVSNDSSLIFLVDQTFVRNRTKPFTVPNFHNCNVFFKTLNKTVLSEWIVN